MVPPKNELMAYSEKTKIPLLNRRKKWYTVGRKNSGGAAPLTAEVFYRIHNPNKEGSLMRRTLFSHRLFTGILCLIIAAGLSVALAGCGSSRPAGSGGEPKPGFQAPDLVPQQGEQLTQEPPKPQSPGTSGAARPAAFLQYPQDMLASLEGTGMYRYAQKKDAVIICDEVPVTGSGKVYRFIDDIRQGRDSSIEILRFFVIDQGNGAYENLTDHTVLFQEKGRPGVRSNYYYTWDGEPEPAGSDEYVPEIDQIFLSDYGFLTWQSTVDDWQMGAPVIHPVELYENYYELDALQHRYLVPIYGLEIGYPWDTYDEISPSWLFVFEDLYHYETGRSPWLDYGQEWPMPVILETLNTYFYCVTEEMILEKEDYVFYDPDRNVITSMGGRGGPDLFLRVVDFNRNGRLLAVEYVVCDPATGEPFPEAGYVLKVRLNTDGGFYYQSIEESPEVYEKGIRVSRS
jgi:hypothetical protein